jgi:hypothetical protein
MRYILSQETNIRAIACTDDCTTLHLVITHVVYFGAGSTRTAYCLHEIVVAKFSHSRNDDFSCGGSISVIDILCQSCIKQVINILFLPG